MSLTWFSKTRLEPEHQERKQRCQRSGHFTKFLPLQEDFQHELLRHNCRRGLGTPVKGQYTTKPVRPPDHTSEVLLDQSSQETHAAKICWLTTLVRTNSETVQFTVCLMSQEDWSLEVSAIPNSVFMYSISSFLWDFKF